MQIQLRNPEAQNAPGGENDQMTIADLILSQMKRGDKSLHGLAQGTYMAHLGQPKEGVSQQAPGSPFRT